MKNIKIKIAKEVILIFSIIAMMILFGGGIILRNTIIQKYRLNPILKEIKFHTKTKDSLEYISNKYQDKLKFRTKINWEKFAKRAGFDFTKNIQKSVSKNTFNTITFWEKYISDEVDSIIWVYTHEPYYIKKTYKDSLSNFIYPKIEKEKHTVESLEEEKTEVKEKLTKNISQQIWKAGMLLLIVFYPLRGIYLLLRWSLKTIKENKPE